MMEMNSFVSSPFKPLVLSKYVCKAATGHIDVSSEKEGKKNSSIDDFPWRDCFASTVGTNATPLICKVSHTTDVQLE